MPEAQVELLVNEDTEISDENRLRQIHSEQQQSADIVAS